jgi:predicted transcriptional regulator
VAFYIYGFIKFKNGLYKDWYQASFEILQEELGMSTSTLYKYLKSLEDYGLVEVKHQIFKLGEAGESNSYMAK